MTPAPRRKESDARRGKLGKDRTKSLVDGLAALVRAEFEAGNIGTKLGLEGPFRHALRSDLCLQGWRWPDANEAARQLMDMVQSRVGAMRPSWKEGQQEWTVEAGTLIERTLCARCRKPLPEDAHKFCGEICAKSHHAHLSAMRTAKEGAATRLATHSI